MPDPTWYSHLSCRRVCWKDRLRHPRRDHTDGRSSLRWFGRCRRRVRGVRIYSRQLLEQDRLVARCRRDTRIGLDGCCRSIYFDLGPSASDHLHRDEWQNATFESRLLRQGEDIAGGKLVPRVPGARRAKIRLLVYGRGALACSARHDIVGVVRVAGARDRGVLELLDTRRARDHVSR